MKKFLSLIGSLGLVTISSASVIACFNKEDKMSEGEVANAILKIANEGIEYKGPFIFDYENVDQSIINKFISERYLIWTKEPSIINKLLTNIFMEKLYEQYPKIFTDYPDFTLECVVNRWDKTESTYKVAYNLVSAQNISKYYDVSSGKVVRYDNNESSLDIDNFIGNNTYRVNQFLLNSLENNECLFTFKFEQTEFIQDAQKRMDFILNLYNKDTLPIKLFDNQNYETLNMFSSIGRNIKNIPELGNDPKFINKLKMMNDLDQKKEVEKVKAIVRKRIDDRLLTEDQSEPNLKLLNIIDETEIKLELVDIFTRDEMITDFHWNKVININYPYPGYLGFVRFDIEIGFKYKGISSSVKHKERIFFRLWE